MIFLQNKKNLAGPTSPAVRPHAGSLRRRCRALLATSQRAQLAVALSRRRRSTSSPSQRKKREGGDQGREERGGKKKIRQGINGWCGLSAGRGER